MSLTPNFGFNIPASTDIVNLLTQCYPNFNIADTAMKAIKEQGISQATESKSGTVHNIVRVDSDCSVFWFTATSNFVTGDTFTVDGSPVTAVKVSGAGLETGDFVINSNVPCIVKGSVLTVLAGGAGTPTAQDVSYDNSGSGLTANDVQDAIDELKSDIPTGFSATAITYDNSGSGLTATNAQDAIDELASSIGPSGSVSVTADGAKSNATLLNGLYALIDSSKITKDTKLLEYKGGAVYYHYFSRTDGTSYSFSRLGVSSTLDAITIKVGTASTYWQSSNLTQTNQSSTVPASGTIFEIVY